MNAYQFDANDEKFSFEEINEQNNHVIFHSKDDDQKNFFSKILILSEHKEYVNSINKISSDKNKYINLGVVYFIEKVLKDLQTQLQNQFIIDEYEDFKNHINEKYENYLIFTLNHLNRLLHDNGFPLLLKQKANKENVFKIVEDYLLYYSQLNKKEG